MMKKLSVPVRIIILAIIAASAAAMVGFALINDRTAMKTERLKIAATIFPLCDIVKNVSGESADVVCILPPGSSPHFYEFGSGLLRKMEGAKVIFAIGHGMDDWALKIKNSIGAETEIIIADREVALRKAKEAKADEDDKNGTDPHYWLNFENARKITYLVEESLSRTAPENKSVYSKNASAYIEKLNKKERKLKSTLTDIPSKKIVVFHDAWNYFADNFGLEIIDSFEPTAGGEPTPRTLAELSDEVRKNDVRVIFAEPQFSSKTIRAFADDLGLGIAVLDPLGGVPGRETFLKLMEYNARAIVEAAR